MSKEHGVDERTTIGPAFQPRRDWAAAAALTGLRQTLGAYAAGFDPALVTPVEASMVADEAAKIESIASVVRDEATSRAGGRAIGVERAGR